MSFASNFTQFPEFRHISQHSARNLCKMADLAIFPTRFTRYTCYLHRNREQFPFYGRYETSFCQCEGKRIPTPVTRSLARNDSASRCSGGQSRPPLRTLSLRGAKRRGNPFPFSEGRIPTPVTRSLARNDMGGAMWASPPADQQERDGENAVPYENDHPFGWSFSTLLCSCQRTSSPTVGLLAA